MNKHRRQELKQLKYIKRIKKDVGGYGVYITRDGEYIYNFKAQDIINDKGKLFYKTTSTPCSCWMCSGEYKYKRHKHKEETRRLIKEEYYENKVG